VRERVSERVMAAGARASARRSSSTPTVSCHDGIHPGRLERPLEEETATEQADADDDDCERASESVRERERERRERERERERHAPSFRE
jgi:hypothetical protein